MTVQAGDDLAGLDEIRFPATTSPGQTYAHTGQASASRSHVYTFDGSDTFSDAAQVTATDRATNAATAPPPSP